MNIPNITPNHQAIVQSILAEREAEFENHVAECDEALADFPREGEIRTFPIWVRGRRKDIEKVYSKTFGWMRI